VSPDETLPTEQQRAIHAVVAGAALGMVLALLARRRR
jgi:MYXO-CTERM domain-containing protein